VLVRCSQRRRRSPCWADAGGNPAASRGAGGNPAGGQDFRTIAILAVARTPATRARPQGHTPSGCHRRAHASPQKARAGSLEIGSVAETCLSAASTRDRSSAGSSRGHANSVRVSPSRRRQLVVGWCAWCLVASGAFPSYAIASGGPAYKRYRTGKGVWCGACGPESRRDSAPRKRKSACRLILFSTLLPGPLS
jgi:hypothetical protein